MVKQSPCWISPALCAALRGGAVGDVDGVVVAQVLVVAEVQVLEHPEHPTIGQRVGVRVVASAETLLRRRRTQAGRREGGVQLGLVQPTTPAPGGRGHRRDVRDGDATTATALRTATNSKRI